MRENVCNHSVLFGVFLIGAISLDARHRLCPDCGDLRESSTTVTFQFAIRVADQSGELNINISAPEAVSEIEERLKVLLIVFQDMFLPGLSASDARDDTEVLKMHILPLLGHLGEYHEELDDAIKRDPGPLLDLCVYSWVPETHETERLYKLFGCRLRTEVS